MQLLIELGRIVAENPGGSVTLAGIVVGFAWVSFRPRVAKLVDEHVTTKVAKPLEVLGHIDSRIRLLEIGQELTNVSAARLEGALDKILTESRDEHQQTRRAIVGLKDTIGGMRESVARVEERQEGERKRLDSVERLIGVTVREHRSGWRSDLPDLAILDDEEGTG